MKSSDLSTGIDLTEDLPISNNLSRVMKQETATFGIDAENVRTPQTTISARTPKSIRREVNDKSFTLAQICCRAPPPGIEWKSLYGRMGKVVSPSAAETILAEMINEEPLRSGFLVALEGESGINIVALHGVEKSSHTWTSFRWQVWNGEILEGCPPNTCELTAQWFVRGG